MGITSVVPCVTAVLYVHLSVHGTFIGGSGVYKEQTKLRCLIVFENLLTVQYSLVNFGVV